MLVVFLVILGILGLLLTVALVLSHRLTDRHIVKQTRSPAELGLPFEDIQFIAQDRLTLRGWWIPSTGSNRAVIFLHGYAGSMDPDIEFAPAFHQAGFNVLMFDFRGHGRSDGWLTTVGCLERRDALAAVEYLQSRGVQHIGLFGRSMGGIVAMLTAPICPAVEAVVEDSGPAWLGGALKGWGQEHSIPGWLMRPLIWLTLAGASLRSQANLFRSHPYQWIDKMAPRPILFIQGDHDPYRPPADFDALFAAAGEGKEVWRLPDAGHVTTSDLYPEEYRQRIIEFFDQHLGTKN